MSGKRARLSFANDEEAKRAAKLFETRLANDETLIWEGNSAVAFSEKRIYDFVVICMNQRVQFRFDPVKSAQAAAFFLKRHDGSLSKYILLKLLYLADREALRKWNIPITGDEPYSMKFGPVPSRIYDLTKDGIRFADIWEPVIKTESVRLVSLKSDPGQDELSDEEIELLEEIYQKFKRYDFEKMKEYCHSLPEYDSSTGNGSKLITFENLLHHLGKTEEEIQYVATSENEARVLRDVFGA